MKARSPAHPNPSPPSLPPKALHQLHEAHVQMARFLCCHSEPEPPQTPFCASITLPLVLLCEDCGAHGITWNLCYHCGRMVCQTCYTHHHQCLPDHKPRDCPALKRFTEGGLAFVQTLRINNGLPPLGDLPKLK